MTKARTTQRRVVTPNDSDGGVPVKIPRTAIPEPMMKGMRGWRTPDGWLVVRVHYSADPDRDDAWVEEFSKGYRGGVEGRDWRRELEIDFGAYEGEPVYPQFDGFGSIKQVAYNPHLPLWRGWDFGYRNPAVVFLQLWPDDTLVQLAEVFPTLDKGSMPGIKTPDLARMVIEETDRLFPGAQDDDQTAGVKDYCDPAGNQTKETSDFSSVEHLQTFGINPEWAVVGRKNRIEYLRNYIETTHDDGKRRFLIHPRCVLTIKALEGGYHYPDEKKGGADRDMPDTSKGEQQKPYVHLMDALEYPAAVEFDVEDMIRHTRKAQITEDDGEIAGMNIGSLTTAGRQDLYEERAYYNEDPEIDLDDLLGIDEDLEEAFALL